MQPGRPQLKLQYPPGEERIVSLEGDRLTIGRRPESDIVISETDISRLQAEILRDGDGYVLIDAGSTFGTFVNGSPISRHRLRNRDIIAMGRERQIEIRFLLDDRMSRILHDVDSRSRADSSPDASRNLAILLEICTGLNSMTSLQDMLELALDAIVDVAQAERGFLMLKDGEGRLQVRSVRNLARESLGPDGLRFSRSIVEEAARTGEPLYLADISERREIQDRASVEELALRSVVCLPLKLPPADQVTRPSMWPDDSNVVGVIYADSMRARSPITELTRDLIRSISVQVTLAVESFYLRQEDLERRLAEREMEQEMERLRELDRVKTEFVSNVSHELRTPLTAIKGSLQNMLDGLTGAIGEKQRRYLERMNDNADQLSRLIDDLLDLARIESGRIHLRRRSTSIVRLLEDAAESLRPLAERRGIHLGVEPPPGEVVIEADRDRLMQVLFNLVGNALKFTPEGGRVVLAARAEQSRVLITVADTGPGIPSSELERIFDRFHQLQEPGAAKSVGTGLGLPISRSLVEMHGGRLWAECEGAGTRFLLALPLGPIAAGTGEEARG